MKKVNNIFGISKFSLSVICLFIFNFLFCTCGLDVLYVIEPPMPLGGVVDQTASFDSKYFEFRTNEESISTEGLRILGTDVYYCIYDNIDKLISDTSYINDTDNNSSSKDKLTSSGRKFKTLQIQNVNSSVLIPYDKDEAKNKNVKIRLSDYQNSEEFAAKITVDGSNIGKPVRNISERNNFNFGRNGTKEGKPNSDDDDLYLSSSDSTVFYVAMYAVAVGFDAAYTNYFSEPLYLGCVKIDSEEWDN